MNYITSTHTSGHNYLYGSHSITFSFMAHHHSQANGVVNLRGQPLLLSANDGSWSTNPKPSNYFSCREPIMLHHVATNEGASATKTSYRRKKFFVAFAIPYSFKNNPMILAGEEKGNQSIYRYIVRIHCSIRHSI